MGFLRRDKTRKQLGYEHAAGALLKDPSGAPFHLQEKVDEARSFGTFDPFDQGVLDAVNDMAKLLDSFRRDAPSIPTIEEVFLSLTDEPTPSKDDPVSVVSFYKFKNVPFELIAEISKQVPAIYDGFHLVVSVSHIHELDAEDQVALNPYYAGGF